MLNMTTGTFCLMPNYTHPSSHSATICIYAMRILLTIDDIFTLLYLRVYHSHSHTNTVTHTLFHIQFELQTITLELFAMARPDRAEIHPILIQFRRIAISMPNQDWPIRKVSTRSAHTNLAAADRANENKTIVRICRECVPSGQCVSKKTTRI